jgi:ribosomal-protein-alanine N-acetyltransferase
MTPEAIPVVRQARPPDVQHVTRIDALAYGRGEREAYFASACRGVEGPEPQLLVVLIDDQVCGYLAYALVLEEATVRDVAVHPQYQGMGLGRCLLQAALQHMRDRGASRCLLEVRSSNRGGVALYRGSGFKLDGERRNYYPAENGREDALLMSLQL